jgi:hypothetical protein
VHSWCKWPFVSEDERDIFLRQVRASEKASGVAWREKSENPEAIRAALAEQTNKITALFTATLLEPLHTLCVYVCGGALACSQPSLKSFSAS